MTGSSIANVVSLEEISAEYESDTYGEDDTWATEAPDLGENA
ncbi:MAG: hypothetical protein U5K70_08070 [Halodesulfurarchaeum sp.]|nr:hypothetical protein [Halodesulfurarchaeum sp.]